jgi:hypothetical protein
MRLDAYQFDGIGNVRCRKCKTVHEVAFDGTDLDTIEEAIDSALVEAGWDVYSGLCSNCYDPDELEKGDVFEDDELDTYEEEDE